ncbi:MAG: hypothetical protein N5P05_003789 [Chroococcopsis gigantea SAG 12.99]|nr:glycosyltransferase family 2 protein [Chlorogloea purpurea SAG 13.99]MDV3002183.1 hypothetical protein [Chroococcopsis gigantea SAG 12.99]
MVKNTELLKISCVIVARNSERYLRDAIDSIIAQTYANYEIILVDGQSTDSTASIAQSYPGVRYIYQNTLGLAQARNLGLQNARGEWIAFLDSDDRWTPNKLTLQANALQNYPSLQYVTAHLQLVSDAATSLRNGYRERDLEAPKWGRTPGVLLARRSLFEQVGYFATELRIAGDLEWFARVQESRIPTLTLPDVLLYKRVRPDSLSSRSGANRQEIMAVLRRSIARKKDA